MSNEVSLNFRKAMNAEHTDEVAVLLIVITHEDMPDGPIRLSTDPTTRFSVDPLVYGTISRGNQYIFLPFIVRLPDERDEAAPQAEFVITNVDRELIRLVRSTTTPATVSIELVLSSAPDYVEREYPEFDLVSADYDGGSLTLGLSVEALAFEPFPAGSFEPSSFGGLF